LICVVSADSLSAGFVEVSRDDGTEAGGAGRAVL
jgi:hypothetical protein